MSQQTTALVKVTYQGLQSINDVRDALSANLGGEGISPLDLDRVKFPSGGGTVWEIPSIEGPSDAREIEGIIVFQHHARSYWAQSIEESGGNNPPNCQSADGKTGVGDPGGDCAACPLNQFGSHAKGAGKACKESWILYILRPDDVLPLVMPVPPSSLKIVRKYLLALTSKGIPYRHAVTKIGLDKTKNGAGIVYAQARLSFVRRLEPDEKAQSDAYSRNLEQIVAANGARMGALVGEAD